MHTPPTHRNIITHIHTLFLHTEISSLLTLLLHTQILSHTYILYACFMETKGATPTPFDHQVYLKGLTAQTRYGLLIAAPTPLRSPHLTVSTKNVLAEHKNACFTETENAMPTPFDHQVYLKSLTVQTRYGHVRTSSLPLVTNHI